MMRDKETISSMPFVMPSTKKGIVFIYMFSIMIEF